jgi:hypothetical protein
VAHQLTRDHLSVICALVQNGKRKGRLLMQVRDRAFCGQSVIGFLLHLLGQLKGKLLVIWDGASIHRSKAVQAFLASPVARRLRVERLPGYAPELNPVEAVWQYLKRVELRKSGTVGCRALRAWPGRGAALGNRVRIPRGRAATPQSPQ